MTVREAFRVEADRLAEILLALDEAEFDAPTRCRPWTVRELTAHVRAATGRLLTMLAEQAPPRAEVDAAGYYGPAKFTPDTDATRIAGARREATEASSGRSLAVDFDRTRRAVYAAVAAEPPVRVVRTRHGDPMTVDDFLLTRLVELGVHGLDLVAALDRRPWLTEPAAAAITGLLLGRGDPAVLDRLGWDRLTFVAKATGRAPLTGAERAEVDRHGIRWLSFG
jgi:uncharacterized protein (TIGR03083 family)